MTLAEAEAILAAKGWLAGQSLRIRRALLDGAKLVHFAKGDYAFRAGDPPGGMHGIAAGSFGIYLSTPFRGPSLSHILHPGWWCGEGPILGGRRRILTAVAMEPSITLHIPFEPGRRLVQSDPEAARSIGMLGQIAMGVAIANVSDLLIQRVDRRVGAVLLRVTGAMEGAELRPTGEVRLTQEQLGCMANVSRNMVNRTLAEFETAGWVRLGYNRLAILDPESLAAFAFARE
ncbi:Crp/Fnr family transcriptional regulator [Dankookia sp. GCM10030260]|uniref:Crp/Fnr family transcriptional regulator n=1 Tax=Dankookia sp. GCM10030260 TaxID=3273390 RepID=UPI003612DFE8